jgi:hypothetical protein
LTHRSLIGRFPQPYAICSTPDDASRVFVSDDNRISCIDVKSGAVRLFVGIGKAEAMRLADGLLYAVHDGALSIVHIDSGAIQQSAGKTLHGQSWTTARGISVLPDFACISDHRRTCALAHGCCALSRRPVI